MAWYYEKDGTEEGPVNAKVLKQLARQGVVTRETPVWKEGGTKRVPAKQVQGLFAAKAATREKAAVPTEQTLPRGLSIASLVMGILSITIGGCLLGVIAIPIGLVALIKCNKGEMRGRGMAIGGVAMGIASIFLTGAIWLYFLADPRVMIKARMAANETHAAFVLNTTYKSAQEIFQRGNYSAKINPENVREYAHPFTQLYGDDRHFFELISKRFADATTPEKGLDGYYFVDAADKGKNSQEGYGLFAVPCIYNTTGIHTFYIDERGTVYQKDIGAHVPINSTEVDQTWEAY